jgi:hypothetical protein
MTRDEMIYECYVLRAYDCDELPEQEYLNYLTELSTNELEMLLEKLIKLANNAYTFA